MAGPRCENRSSSRKSIMNLRSLLFLLVLAPSLYADSPAKPLELGSRRELFVDNYLIDTIKGVSLRLETPRDEGIVMRFDKPWEGKFSGYGTVFHDIPPVGESEYRHYYRGWDDSKDESSAVT